MHKTLIVSSALFGLALAAFAFPQSAFAQTSGPSVGARPGHAPGEGVSQPFSTDASNINRADTRSEIAPQLPQPRVGADAGWRGYVQNAQRALSQNRTGEAQAAMEQAQTALLNARQVTADQVGGPLQQTIEQARQALGRHDILTAQRLLGQALAENAPSAAVTMGQPGIGGQPRMGAVGESGIEGGMLGSDNAGSSAQGRTGSSPGYVPNYNAAAPSGGLGKGRTQ